MTLLQHHYVAFDDVRLHYVEVDTVQGVPVRSVPESYAVVRTAAGRYALTHDGPVGVGRRGYFVAEVTDRRNDVWNTFGVWRVTAFADGAAQCSQDGRDRCFVSSGAQPRREQASRKARQKRKIGYEP